MCYFNVLKHNWFYYIVILICNYSCSRPVAKFIDPEYYKPGKIAILPTLYNENDTTATRIFRHLLYEEMQKKEYCRLLTLPEIDVLLAQSGIDYTDYSQLLHLDKLFRLLEVDGLMYSQILDLSFTATQKKVHANFKLFTPVFYMIWEDEREVKRTRSSGSGCTDIVAVAIVDLFITPLIKSASRTMHDHELKQEMQKCIHLSLKTLP